MMEVATCALMVRAHQLRDLQQTSCGLNALSCVAESESGQLSQTVPGARERETTTRGTTVWSNSVPRAAV